MGITSRPLLKFSETFNTSEGRSRVVALTYLPLHRVFFFNPSIVVDSLSRINGPRGLSLV